MQISQERKEKFISVVQNLNPSTRIMLAGFDPDSASSALALKALINKLIRPELDIVIPYCGDIGRPMNKAIMNHFNLYDVIIPIDGWKPSGKESWILVDSPKMNDSRLPEIFKKLQPDIIFDHHMKKAEEKPEAENEFIMIEKVGATATLIVELARAFEFDFKSEKNRDLAILLALGIYTDTGDLVNSYQRDREAYGYITEGIEPHELRQLKNYPLSETYLKNLALALKNMDRDEDRIILGSGMIPEAEVDDLPTIADHILRPKNVSFVAVWCIVGENTIIKFRSIADENLNDFIIRKFGEGAGGAKNFDNGPAEGGVIISSDLKQFRPNSKKTIQAYEKFVRASLKERIF
jgi:nanoRNase/pAp phosphatase (c-di-AMP/oligoRNAs hydrolase)